MKAVIELVLGDITAMEVEAIVNAANASLMGGGGVDGAIHRKGGAAILADCIKIRARQGGCKTGEAVVTTAGNLAAMYVIHTVGPVWHNGTFNEPQSLQNCYLNSLRLADQLGLKSIAFPNISTGVYGYPKEAAADLAIQTVLAYVKGQTQLQRIVFVCFDPDNYAIYEAKLKAA